MRPVPVESSGAVGDQASGPFDDRIADIHRSVQPGRHTSPKTKRGARSAPSSQPSEAARTSGLRGVLLAEPIDATARVDDLLLARVERVAVGADFDLQVLAQRRTRLEHVAAAAGDLDRLVIRVDCVFHGRGLPAIGPKWAANYRFERAPVTSTARFGASPPSRARFSRSMALELQRLSTKAVDNFVDECVCDWGPQSARHTAIPALVNF